MARRYREISKGRQLRPNGTVKVLDVGLAKFAEAGRTGEAGGKSKDKRSDIWSD
jgi:hypothetical protein